MKAGFIGASGKAWANNLGDPLSLSALGIRLSLFVPFLLKGDKDNRLPILGSLQSKLGMIAAWSLEIGVKSFN